MPPAISWDGRVVTAGLLSLICADVIRPGISWLLTTATPKRLAAEMARTRDPAGLTGLAARCDASPVGEATTRLATSGDRNLAIDSRFGVRRDHGRRRFSATAHLL